MPTAPCDWPLAFPPGWPDAPEPNCADCEPLRTMSEEERQAIIDMATELLWRWTDRMFGLCEVTVRPCRSECGDRPATFWGSAPTVVTRSSGWMPTLIGGQWYNIGCGSCAGTCSCLPDTARTLELPGTVNSIVSIVIEGETLPETAYALRDGILYRTDGGVWPSCNSDIEDPALPDSGAWEITYLRGVPVPPGGQLAAYKLACELARAACGDEDCALPQRVQSVTRQGVTVAVLDSFEDVQEGRTGIWSIDSWVASVRAPLPAPVSVYSPDMPGRRGVLTGFGRRVR